MYQFRKIISEYLKDIYMTFTHAAYYNHHIHNNAHRLSIIELEDTDFKEWLELVCELIDGIEIQYDVAEEAILEILEESEDTLEELNVKKEHLIRPKNSELLTVNSVEEATNKYFVNLFKENCKEVDSSEVYIDESGEINFLIECESCEKYINKSYDYAIAPFNGDEYKVFNEVIEELGIEEHSEEYVMSNIEWCRCEK